MHHQGGQQTCVVAVPVRRGRLAVALIATGIVLVLWSLAWQYSKGQGWEPFSLLLDRVLDADEDRSVLNWLSTSTFLAAALVATLQARVGTSARFGWYAVAAGLLLVSLDEVVGLHDPLKGRLTAIVQDRGPAVIAVLAGVLVLGLLAGRFLAGRPRDERWRLVVAIALLAFAAVGIDSFGRDLIDDPAARLQLGYLLKASAEELVELTAAVLTLDACLLAVLGSRSPELRRDGPLHVQERHDSEKYG